jgi:hypothetical protein
MLKLGTRKEEDSDMSFAHVVWQEKVQIVHTSHLAIVHGMLDTWQRCNYLGSNPDEPDFVAGLVLESTPILYQAFSAIFAQHGIQFSLAAVFCHQTPKVQFAGMTKTSCEVGDLLIVHIHTARSGAVTRNALLYQAKMSSKQPYRIGSAEGDQLALYTRWPEFEYLQSPPLSGQRRDVMPKLPHMGAQYMLIDDRPPSDPQSGLLGVPDTYPIGSCMADLYLYDHNHLAAELFNFLLLRSGRPFTDASPVSTVDDWSQVVWDLLRGALKKAFNRKKSGRSSRPRHAGGPVAMFDGYFFAQATTPIAFSTAEEVVGREGAVRLYSEPPDGPPYDEYPRDNVPTPDNGVSLILLETLERRSE